MRLISDCSAKLRYKYYNFYMPVTKAAYVVKSVIPMSNPKVKLIRIEPTDLNITLREIYVSLSNLCWINNLLNANKMFQKSAQKRAEATISKLKGELKLTPDSELSKSAGEYVVSELAHSTVVNDVGYLDIPLAELFKQKKKGNPGFDFFSVNPKTLIMLFGEAKYKSRANAYDNAFVQIKKFIKSEKDVTDMYDLEHFCPEEAQNNMLNGDRGFIAAFSSTSMSDKVLASHIEKNAHYKALLKYNELVCVAVNLS